MSIPKTYARHTITAALPYANGPLHIGHIAGAYLPADIYARFLRLKQKDVLFVCGSDEHGAAITLRAKKEGISPKEIIDKYHTLNKETFEKFGIQFDIYDRTSSDIHKETSQDFFKKLHADNRFVEHTNEQFYDEDFQQFLADRYVTGECPECGYENAYGDQCERCGTSLNPTDLKNPKSTLSGKKPVLRSTTHWYLPMQDYENWLKNWIVKEKKGVWKNNVYGQCKSWIDQGLQERAMTRDLDWGVPVPVEGADGKVLYVWLDAPIGYISASKAWAEKHGKNWEDYWKKDDTQLIHFIGKDNIVFHCIIFPILLKAHGEYVLPEHVPANEFLNLEGDKISTSRDWAVWLHEYLEDFEGYEDSLRYTLTSIAPETKDSEFTWQDFQNRHNNELVATLGNFVNRTLVLTHKYFEGTVGKRGTLSAYDKEVLQKIGAFKARIEEHILQFKFREAQQELLELARMGNKYLADTQPWKLIKDDRELTATILNICTQITASLAVLMEPFLPFTAKRLRQMLDLDRLVLPANWERVGEPDLVPPSWIINKAELLFTKLENEKIQAQLQKLETKKLQNQPVAAVKENIAFEDFTKLDLRIVTVKAAEKVKKAKKLLQLTIDTGAGEKTVISGIAQHYAPEDLVGKQVCWVANLAPRKIRGVMSEGMILMAEDRDGTLRALNPDSEVFPGSVVS